MKRARARPRGNAARTAHNPAVLVKAWQRAVLELFGRQGCLEEDAAASMLARPQS